MKDNPIQIHITEDMRPRALHPDKWKWERATILLDLRWNEYLLRQSGYKGKAEDYYRQFRFAMNQRTRDELDEITNFVGITSVVSDRGLSMAIQGIEIRVDNNLPFGRIVLIKGYEWVSFDWRGRIGVEIDEIE